MAWRTDHEPAKPWPCFHATLFCARHWMYRRIPRGTTLVAFGLQRFKQHVDDVTFGRSLLFFLGVVTFGYQTLFVNVKKWALFNETFEENMIPFAFIFVSFSKVDLLLLVTHSHPVSSIRHLSSEVFLWALRPFLMLTAYICVRIDWILRWRLLVNTFKYLLVNASVKWKWW